MGGSQRPQLVTDRSLNLGANRRYALCDGGLERSPAPRINEHSVAPQPTCGSSDGLLLFSSRVITDFRPGAESGYSTARDVQNSRDKGACVLRALSQWPAVIAASRARRRQRRRLAARRCCRSACLRSGTTSRLSLSSPPLIGPSYDRDVRRIASGAPTTVIAGPDTEM